MSRQQLPPPSLEGYRHLRRIGSGGFSDVFLYERDFPRQEVAIKVLDREGARAESEERFMAEANAMASVSGHPYIVTIFHADISPDGHPYLVMEYYPGENFAERMKSGRLGVAEVLRTGIQVASAVETAHRAGILHRDIKPANILTSAYGRPGLTDFGIAASQEAAGEAEGLSIPWSPPEALVDGAVVDERGDVYSLAATIYSLLEGRSPFERSGERNRSIDLIDRIEREPLAQMNRTDVPGSLQRLVAHAMSKAPAGRPDSAAAFARSLQAIEAELRLDVTPLELSEGSHARPTTIPIDADAGSTRVKAPTVVESQRSTTDLTETIHRVPIDPSKSMASTSGLGISEVPFSVPDVAPAAPGSTGVSSALPAGPRSGSYTGTPLPPRLVVPGDQDRQIDRGAWWKDRRGRTVRTVAIAAAVIAVAAVVLVLLLSSSGNSSGKHALTRPSTPPGPAFFAHDEWVEAT